MFEAAKISLDAIFNSATGGHLVDLVGKHGQDIKSLSDSELGGMVGLAAVAACLVSQMFNRNTVTIPGLEYRMPQMPDKPSVDSLSGKPDYETMRLQALARDGNTPRDKFGRTSKHPDFDSGFPSSRDYYTKEEEPLRDVHGRSPHHPDYGCSYATIRDYGPRWD